LKALESLRGSGTIQEIADKVVELAVYNEAQLGVLQEVPPSSIERLCQRILRRLPELVHLRWTSSMVTSFACC
jgi:hypothetical protein